jgi:hypothetical protein
MTTQDSLRACAQQLLAAAGLPSDEVIHEVVHPEHFGDSEVAFKVGPMHLRFVRQRGQDFVDVSPASMPGQYHQFGDVELAMGWKTVDQVWSRNEPEPLTSVVERLRAHYAEFADAFSSAKASETLEKLSFASRRRGAAFVDHLNRLAEAARKK